MRAYRRLTVNDDLKDMLKISNAVGNDPQLIQGGGGNTSVKTDDGRLMYVKASGTRLGDMREGAGYRLVDVAACRAIADDESLGNLPTAEREAAVLSRLVDATRDDLEGRPSVETSLHAMLGRCVVHTHPSVVNGPLCAEDGGRLLADLFGDWDRPYLYIDYCGAGYSLAVRMKEELARYDQEHGCLPEAIFLENHGLFVTTEDADRGLELTQQIFDTIAEAVREAVEEAGRPEFEGPAGEEQRALVRQVTAAMRAFYPGVFGRPALVRFHNDEVVREFLRLPEAPELARVNPLSPDQVVYCKDSPVWAGLEEDPAALREAVEDALEAARADAETPVCVLVEGLGLFCAAPNPKLLDAASAMMRAALETLSIAVHFGGARGLSDEAIEWLRNWEVEQFRRSLVETGDAREDLEGKVALVTGAGGGLGRGISLSLAQRGMYVVLADINMQGADETAERIEQQGAEGGGFPVWADVTSEGAVEDLLYQVVRELGGVDVLVNCAGIAPAHKLTEFPLREWELALKLNLTGYFLMAREAARRMVEQGAGGAIINISSKSGLHPSQNNSAYNATKAGEIHLARGWALDLAEHGIRVNTICPGNVFTESSIWNEDYIRALAEKRGIEPEEVIPYYVNLTALKEEITWDDIGDAVAFLAGGRASKITGQTLVVDAGQVFVR